MSLFSGISADKSADASADALCIIILEYLNEEEDLTNLKMRMLKINNRENGRRPERTIFRKCIRMICNKLNDL